MNKLLDKAVLAAEQVPPVVAEGSEQAGSATSSIKPSQAQWQNDYAAQIGVDRDVVNRSGVSIQPLYTALDRASGRQADDLAMPGQPPFARGIYATMHRGRTWTQRQLVGLGTPADYNARLLEMRPRCMVA